MSNTHTWSIDDLERNVANGGVYNVIARITSTDGTNTAERVIKVGFAPDPTNPDYTPYDDLTKTQVLGWVLAEVNQTAIEEGQDSVLANKAADATGKPWT